MRIGLEYEFLPSDLRTRLGAVANRSPYFCNRVGILLSRTYLNNTRVMHCWPESDDCRARSGRIALLCSEEQCPRRTFLLASQWSRACCDLMPKLVAGATSNVPEKSRLLMTSAPFVAPHRAKPSPLRTLRRLKVARRLSRVIRSRGSRLGVSPIFLQWCAWILSGLVPHARAKFQDDEYPAYIQDRPIQ